MPLASVDTSDTVIDALPAAYGAIVADDALSMVFSVEAVTHWFRDTRSATVWAVSLPAMPQPEVYLCFADKLFDQKGKCATVFCELSGECDFGMDG